IILPGMLPALLRQSFARVTGWDWTIFAYAVIFPIMLTFPVWNYGIAKLGAARTSLFHFAVPILTGILSVLLLGARIERYEVAGALVCIAGMAIAQRLVRIRA
ncbi:MAG: DMT family transporter, partial [Candidatus Eremiobacteraeota bacterium]|nr:DMT family transporter [Candidatus Eremiobacteraeota bacterium]